MQRAVEIHSGKRPRGEFIPVPEALGQLECKPSEVCINTCEALKKFMRSSMPATAVDLISDQAENIKTCIGPESKIFGRVACGARLR